MIYRPSQCFTVEYWRALVMIGRIRLVHCAGVGPALARSGILLLATFSSSAVYAQCAAVGMNPPQSFPTQTAVTAVAGASAYVGTVAASIHSANTAFLAQSTAFVGAPPNPAPDQAGGGIWARGVGGHSTFDTTATAGNYSFANQWFVEPSAGFIWSRTQVDTMNVPGTLVYGFGGVPPWTLAVKDIDSTLGRLSMRVGTTVAYDNVVLQPFASASVFHEFQGRVTSSLTSDFSAIGMPPSVVPTLSSTVSVTGAGTYGQFCLGVAPHPMSGGS